MKLIYLFLIIFHPTISEEDTFIENFDQRILQDLKHPVTINGRSLYQNMLRYYSDLLDMFNMIKANNRKVIAYVRNLVQHGGPKMLKYNYNLTRLAVTFGWGHYQTRDFNTVFSGIESLWNNITESLQISKDESESSSSYSYSDSDSEMGDCF